jgi:hypothetical protein
VYSVLLTTTNGQKIKSAVVPSKKPVDTRAHEHGTPCGALAVASGGGGGGTRLFLFQ